MIIIWIEKTMFNSKIISQKLDLTPSKTKGLLRYWVEEIKKQFFNYVKIITKSKIYKRFKIFIFWILKF